MNLEDIYRLLRREHVLAQGVVDTLPQPSLVLNESLRVESASRAYYRDFNLAPDDTIGRLFFELGSGQWDRPDLRTLLENVLPRSAAIVDYEISYDFPGIGQRTMLLNACRLNPDGADRVILVTLEDVSEHRKNKEEADLLLGEMRHRNRNLLAIVHALAMQTAAAGRTGEEYRDAFLSRLTALSNANDVSSEASRTPVGLGEVVQSALAPFITDATAILVEPGPAVALQAVQILPLSLILHELATNAVKYGALSEPSGQLRITWEVQGSDKQAGESSLRLFWQEHGGPPTKPPTAPGFGSRLIQFAAAHELGGVAELTYAPKGLSVEIRLPLV